MRLSIIIPTLDRAEILGLTLQAAVKAIENVDAEIIVVNDSKRHIPSIPNTGNITLLNNPKSGVAAARNLGFKNAKGELILFLDNDIIISKKSVDQILKLHAVYSKACINLNWEYSPETLSKFKSLPFIRFLKTFGMTSFKGWYNDPSWRDDEFFDSKSVASFHLSISRKNFEKSLGYNEDFSHSGFEDYDFAKRLKVAGLDFYIDSRITVFHNEIDRFDLDTWLKAQERRAITRKKAVSLGYKELTLEYRGLKRIMLTFITRNESVLKFILEMLPNSTITDPIYFKLISVLQASRIYRGYMFA